MVITVILVTPLRWQPARQSSDSAHKDNRGLNIIIISDIMSAVMPYIGLEEISSDKVGTAKALVAELLGTLILVNIIVWSTSTYVFIAMLRIVE